MLRSLSGDVWVYMILDSIGCLESFETSKAGTRLCGRKLLTTTEAPIEFVDGSSFYDVESEHENFGMVLEALG